MAGGDVPPATGEKDVPACHPEEPKATKDLCSSLRLQLLGFFASLRMTRGEGLFLRPAFKAAGSPEYPEFRLPRQTRPA